MDVVWIIFLFAIGACVGSFLNVVIYRLPRGESIVFPGSHCPSCGRAIKWYDNIPLVSWLVLRGRCRFCKTRISPRYILIEGLTAVLVAGLYVCYYVLHLRTGAGSFEQTWPMFAAHAALLCGLLACSAVDIESWIVPLEVCWVVSVAGLLAAAAGPEMNPWIGPISPAGGAAALAAVIGLTIAIMLQRYGILQPSFLDADDKIAAHDESPVRQFGKKGKHPTKQPPAVAITKAHGVNPRREIMREVLFLAPAIFLAVLVHFLVSQVPPVRNAWCWLTAGDRDCLLRGTLSPYVNGFLAGLLGYLVGGLWVWGTRILGTLAFGKEAMGLGDVHILAAVGAVTGWMVPSLTFFVAPLFGLLWALYLWLRHNQRELPYGPWLAAGTVVVMLLFDKLSVFLNAYMDLLGR